MIEFETKLRVVNIFSENIHLYYLRVQIEIDGFLINFIFLFNQLA